MSVSKSSSQIFENLFVLELANNDWGDLERGKRIVQQYGSIVRYNNIKAAIKLQFRDVHDFIHGKYKGNQEIRYISKTESTQLTKKEFSQLVDEIRNVSCIPMSTPFDEASVDLCVEFDMPIIKIASSDINDWPLIEKIASTKRAVIASTGGASLKDMDDLVLFFENRNIPLALNHCVSLYPSEDNELELNQIDFLTSRYPDHIIGLSSHEYSDWHSSMFVSYAKGARTWERHVDIEYPEEDQREVAPYCSFPHQIDEWFKAFHKAVGICGGSSTHKRVPFKKEIQYLDALVRGVYAIKDVDEGYVFSKWSFQDDFYMAIPLHKGQLSCREVMNGEKLLKAVKKDQPLTIDDIDGPYSDNDELKKLIYSRGINHIIEENKTNP